MRGLPAAASPLPTHPGLVPAALSARVRACSSLLSEEELGATQRVIAGREGRGTTLFPGYLKAC